MNTIKNFDRQNLKMLRPEFEAAFAGIAAKYGIDARLGNAVFDPTNATFKLELSVKADNGTVQSKERVDYQRYAAAYGLKPEWLDTTYREYGGREFRILGLDIKKHKNIVAIADANTGKRFIVAPEIVIAHKTRSQSASSALKGF